MLWVGDHQEILVAWATPGSQKCFQKGGPTNQTAWPNCEAKCVFIRGVGEGKKRGQLSLPSLPWALSQHSHLQQPTIPSSPRGWHAHWVPAAPRREALRRRGAAPSGGLSKTRADWRRPGRGAALRDGSSGGKWRRDGPGPCSQHRRHRSRRPPPGAQEAAAQGAAEATPRPPALGGPRRVARPRPAAEEALPAAPPGPPEVSKAARPPSGLGPRRPPPG